MKRGKTKVKNNSLSEIANYIKDNDDYLIIGHIDPDGDAVGSIMAYKFLLNSLNKSAKILLHSDISSNYEMLFKYLKNHDYYVYKANSSLNKLDSFSNVIVLDTANLERLGHYKKYITKKYIINIDHHQDNSRFGNLNYVNAESSAVGMIIYKQLKFLNVDIKKELGTAIALAVLADTGSLQYPNSDPDSFRLIADLKEAGVDIVEINRFLKSYPSVDYLKMLAEAFHNIKVDEKDRIAWLVLSNQEIKNIKINIEEINNLVNYPRDIRGIEVGISFIEKEQDLIDISFRSHSYLDVSEIAHKFGGGGHPRAAGTKVKGSLNQVIKKVLDEVKKNV